jgi:flagellar motor protein MotB
MRARPHRSFTLALLASLAIGCVRRGEYDAAVADLREARDQAHTMSLEAEQLRAEARRFEIEAQKDRAESFDLKTKNAELERNAEDLMLMNTEIVNRLKGAGQNVEELAKERGSLKQALADTRAQLAEWRRQQAALTARSAQAQKLADALRRPMQEQGVEVATRRGLIVVTIPSDLLFEPGSVSVKVAGRPTLAQIAAALRALTGRRFGVAAHVDSTRAAPNGAAISPNWQLTAGRAAAVTRELLTAGVAPATLSSTASAEFDPIDPSDDAAARAKNRRIEITLEPLPDELPQLNPH